MSDGGKRAGMSEEHMIGKKDESLLQNIKPVENSSQQPAKPPPFTRWMTFVIRLGWIVYWLSVVVAIFLVVVPVVFGLEDYPILVIGSYMIEDEGVARLLPETASRIEEMYGVGAMIVHNPVPLSVIFLEIVLLLVFAVEYYLVLRWLSGIVRSYAADTPFHPDNAIRLRKMGVVILIVAAVDWILSPVIVAKTSYWLNAPGVETHWSYFDLTWFIIGIGLLMLAQVFKRGTELQLENELTV